MACGSCDRIGNGEKLKKFFPISFTILSTHSLIMQIVQRINVQESNYSGQMMHITYDDEEDEFKLSRILWAAWKCRPPQDTIPDVQPIISTPTDMQDAHAIIDFVQINADLNDAQLALFPQDPDVSTINTEWRHQIYSQWNHIFLDLTERLREEPSAVPDMAHFSAPNHGVLGIHIDPDEVRGSVVHTWDDDVLVVPAFVRPDIELWVSVTSPTWPIRCFQSWKRGDIYYIPRGVEVHLNVEDRTLGEHTHLKAVLVYGKLCSGDHSYISPEAQRA